MSYYEVISITSSELSRQTFDELKNLVEIRDYEGTNQILKKISFPVEILNKLLEIALYNLDPSTIHVLQYYGAKFTNQHLELLTSKIVSIGDIPCFELLLKIQPLEKTTQTQTLLLQSVGNGTGNLEMAKYLISILDFSPFLIEDDIENFFRQGNFEVADYFISFIPGWKMSHPLLWFKYRHYIH